MVGLFLEGARWDEASHELAEPRPKELYAKMEPPIWLKPTRNDRRASFPHYSCPVYKTVARHGVLSTTGHSTNFVMLLDLPSTRPEKEWVLRGVAAVMECGVE